MNWFDAPTLGTTVDDFQSLFLEWTVPQPTPSSVHVQPEAHSLTWRWRSRLPSVIPSLSPPACHFEKSPITPSGCPSEDDKTVRKCHFLSSTFSLSWLPSASYHSQFSVFHLKFSYEDRFMHLFSHKSFCSPPLLPKQNLRTLSYFTCEKQSSSLA